MGDDVILDVKKAASAPTGYTETSVTGYYYRFTEGNQSNGNIKYTTDSVAKKFEVKFGTDTDNSAFDMQDYAFYECGTTNCDSYTCGDPIPSGCTLSNQFDGDGSNPVKKNKIKLKDLVTSTGSGMYLITVKYSKDGTSQNDIICDPRWENTAGGGVRI